MKPEDQKYYDNYMDLFGTDGWKQFVSDIKGTLDLAKDTATSLATSDEFFVRKGNVNTLSYITNFENIIENNYEAIVASEVKEDVSAAI